MLAVATDHRETVVDIGFREIARQDSHSLRQPSIHDFLSILTKTNKSAILSALAKFSTDFPRVL